MKNFFLLSALMLFALDFQAQEADTTIWKTIMLDSVEIYPWLDYETFKQEVVKMPWRQQFFVPGISKADDEKMIYKKPEREPKGSASSPITLIYNRFNKRERFKRKLDRNRRKFNREMERLGADSLMIPERE